MSTLLHLDSSLNGGNSHTRKVTATFADAWKAANPDGTYAYRDLNVDPAPHMDALTYYSHQTDPAEHNPRQAEAYAVSKAIGDQVLDADVLVLGAPMYNFTIPTTLKSYLDHIGVPRFRTGPDGNGPLTGKKIVVVTSRGGSYAPGTPRQGDDHQEPLLRSFFRFLGAEDGLEFLHTEMALSLVVPDLAQFKDIYDGTHSRATECAKELARA
ncbi:FMN-dependent NADH-azoreductase [Stackebrandtia sp.]|uniref:FMN-dependent NADH-azoreductase n=1 Tax=Stackebrandtia sp. TaxID=2023065 RepID=UPI0032C22595